MNRGVELVRAHRQLDAETLAFIGEAVKQADERLAALEARWEKKFDALALQDRETLAQVIGLLKDLAALNALPAEVGRLRADMRASDLDAKEARDRLRADLEAIEHRLAERDGARKMIGFLVENWPGKAAAAALAAAAVMLTQRLALDAPPPDPPILRGDRP